MPGGSIDAVGGFKSSPKAVAGGKGLRQRQSVLFVSPCPRVPVSPCPLVSSQAYCGVNLLRHVDVPATPWRHLASVALHTYTPLLLLMEWSDTITRELLLAGVSKRGGGAGGMLLGALAWARGAFWAQLLLFVAWTSRL